MERLNLRCPLCGCGGDDDALDLNLHDGTINCRECSEEVTPEAIEAAQRDLNTLGQMVAAMAQLREARQPV